MLVVNCNRQIIAADVCFREAAKLISRTDMRREADLSARRSPIMPLSVR